MRFDRPLEVGATGGHGTVRYRVTRHDPGELVEFRFDPSIGLEGVHRFEVAAVERPEVDGESTVLRHTIEGRATGRMRLLWPLVVRWMHDECVEDALDRAESFVTGTPVRHRRNPWVGFLLRRTPKRLVDEAAQERGDRDRGILLELTSGAHT